MKKRLIICLLLVLALCFTTFVACNKGIDEKYLEELYSSLESLYKNFNGTKTDSFTVPGIVTTFDDKNNDVEVAVKWEVIGTDKVTVGEYDETTGYRTIIIPSERNEEIKFSLKATLVNDKGVAYTRADGTEYSLTLNCTAPYADALKAAKNGFYDAAVKAPKAGVAYKWAALAQYQVLYFKGETVSGKDYQYQSTLNYSEAPDVFLEETEGGYYVYFMNGETKTYVDMLLYGTNFSTGLQTDKTKLQAVYTVHSTGALVAKVKGATEGSKGCNLGIREQYIPKITAINYYLDNETGSHGWKTYEHPLFLLDKEYKLPAQENLTPDQIIDRANALAEGDEMSGRWTLRGEVTEASGDDTFRTATIKVGDKTMIAYGMYTYGDVKVGAVIEVTGVIKNYNGTVEFDKYCTYKLITAAPDGGDEPGEPVETVHKGTADDPYDIADAKLVAASVGSNKTENPVYVTGIVTGIGDASYGEYKFDLVAAVGDTDKCIIFWTKVSTTIPKDGDTVVVKGWLTTYNGSPEILKKDNDNKPIVVSINGVDTGLDSGETPTPPVDDSSILGQLRNAAVSSPVTTDSYILAIWQGSLQKAIYATGVMSGTYLATTENISAAATVVVEEATGGFYLAFNVDANTKKYITITPRSSDATKADISLSDTATSVFTVNSDGLLVSGDFVLGTYGTFNTISVSNISYFSNASVIDNSQYIVRIIPADTTITIPQGTIKASVSNEHSTVTFTTPEEVDGVVTAEWYTQIKFTVATESGYDIVSVKVGTKVLTADEKGVYTVELIGDMEIEVTVRDADSKEAQIELDLADANNTGIASSANETVETKTINNVECTYYNCKQNSGSYGNYVMLCKADASKGLTAGYFIGHVNGTIKKLTITINGNASDKTTYIVLFSATALTGSETGDAVNLKKGTVTPFENSIENAGYFMIKIGNANNGQIVKIVIDYEVSDAPAPSTNEAKIGNTEYATLAEAITAAKAASGEVTITLLKDVTSGGISFVAGDNVNITFDLNGHTLTLGKPLVGSVGTVSQSLHFEKGNTVIIKNGTITTEANSASMLLQNYCNLTLDGVILDGSKLAAEGTAYTLSNNFGTVVVKGNSKIIARETNGVAFDLWYGMNGQGAYDAGVSVTVEAGCTINGAIEYGAHSRVTGTDWIEKTVLVLPEGEYTINYTCDSVTNANANITIGGVKIGQSA